jgi:hypothetical protein
MTRAMVREIRRRARDGHRYVLFRVQKRARPKNWDRVRVVPGVYGRCIGEMDLPGWYLIDVTIDAALRAAQHKGDAGR